jgi:hypothetical protein
LAGANQASRQVSGSQSFTTIARSSIPIGVNYPWQGYGWDFGLHPWGRRPWTQSITGALNEFKDLKIRVVRWFILADGMCYGTGAQAPKWNNQTKYWECTPPATIQVQHIADDFKSLLEEFKRAGTIQLLPSLIDFHWLQTGIPAMDQHGNPVTGIIKGGRYDIIINPNKRKAFLDTVLNKLLDVSKNYRNSIYAWEVINEPEWLMQGHKNPSTWKLDNDPNKARKIMSALQRLNIDYDTVTKQWPGEIPARQTPDRDMEDFVRDATARIKRYGFKATVGSKTASDFRWLRFWKNCGIDLFQFHDYEDKYGKATVALEKDRLDKEGLSPCIIGEFPTRWGRRHTWYGASLSDDAVTESFIRDAKSNKWPLVMPWSVFQKDDATNWPSAKSCIRKLLNEGIIYKGPIWP